MAKIAIVGAGMGGLATAIRLAAQGHRVTVFEKNTRVGGKLNVLERHGYRWDTGPSLITMPFVFQELFQAAGRDFADYAELVPVEPVTRYFYPDAQRTVFDASEDLAKMVEAISCLNPADAANYPRYLDYCRRLYDLTAEVFLFQGFNNWRDLLKMRLTDSFKIDPFRTVHRANRAFFKDARLVQLFDRYATYNGSSPYKAPATLNVIPHVELGLGGWYVRGGIYELAQAYLKLAQELGVEIRTGEQGGVAQILTGAGKVRGVRLLNGEEIAADLVVANTDAAYTYEQLLGGQVKTRNFARLEPSCSGFVLFLGVKQRYEQLAHHNILFSRDYRCEFEDIFKRKLPPNDPTIYICWTGKTDPDHAPAGGSNLFVLVNAPYLSDAFNWETPGVAQNYRNLIIRRMEEFGLEKLEQNIEYEEILTPADLQNRFNAFRGAIYGLSSNNPFSAFLRPPNRARGVKGLYLVGGSSHPGGGVPLVTLSAKIVAGLIEQDHR